MAEIRETYHGASADPQHLAQHGTRLFHRLQGARQHDVIECAIRIVREVDIGIAMHYRQASGDRPGDFRHVDLDAAGVAVLGPEQMVDQRAVAAPDVEHPSARRDHAGDHCQIDAHVLGEETNRVQRAHASKPAWTAHPRRKPARVR